MMDLKSDDLMGVLKDLLDEIHGLLGDTMDMDDEMPAIDEEDEDPSLEVVVETGPSDMSDEVNEDFGDARNEEPFDEEKLKQLLRL